MNRTAALALALAVALPGVACSSTENPDSSAGDHAEAGADSTGSDASGADASVDGSVDGSLDADEASSPSGDAAPPTAASRDGDAAPALLSYMVGIKTNGVPTGPAKVEGWLGRPLDVAG